MAIDFKSRKLSPRTLLISIVAAAVVAVGLTLFLLGRFEVAAGQVALLPDGEGGVERTLGPGDHWRLPWGAEPLPVPRTPIEVAADVVVQTEEGTRLAFVLFADLGVAAGGEEPWVAAAGWQPFLDGVAAVAREALGEELSAVDPAAVFDAERRYRWAGTVARALDGAGLSVSGLVLTAPPEMNPAAVAVARGRVTRLAEPTGTKVVVVGWDGADWLMIEPLLEQGKLPNLARLVEGGVSGELRSEPPLLSPLIWTTIATGKPVAEHGIADFLVQDPETGAMVPISSNSRQVHALWTLLGAFDLTTDVVAWWATWPAEEIEGVMVTDRVAYQLFDYGADEDDPRGKVYPPRVWPRVENHLVPAEEVTWEEMSRFVDISPEELERRWESLPEDRKQEDEINHLRKIIATSKSYHAIGMDLLRRQSDLTLLYYEGTDTVGHLFARYLPPRMPGVSQGEMERYGGALPAFYEWADELLGEVLDAVDDDTVVMLISDHGFFTGEARPESDPSDFAGGAPQWHRLYGVIVGDGPGIEPAELRSASIFDIAPTVLATLGLPVPEDMPGRVLTPLLPPAARTTLDSSRERLASYEVLPRVLPQARMASQEDEDRLRELVALGYVSATDLEDGGRRSAATARRPARPAGVAGVDGTGTAAGGRAAAGIAGQGAQGGQGGQAGLQGIATEAYNLGRIAQREGRLDEAEEHYRTSVQRMPDFAPGYTMLAQVSSQRGDHGEAFDRLVQGFAKARDMPQAAITGLVDEAKEAGRLDDAERVLQRLGSSYGDKSAYHAALGLLHETRGNLGTALEHYERALAIDPLDNLSVEQKVTILRRLGREAEAKRFLTDSFEHARGSVSAMNQLAVSALRQRWPDVAEELLRGVLRSDPGNPGVLANLAASLAQQGRMREASEIMQRAVERDPGNARNYYNLGAMLAEQGRLTEALRAFEKAADNGLRSARVHVAAAKMHFRLGDRAAARRELETAVEIAPGDPEANRLLTALREAPGG